MGPMPPVRQRIDCLRIKRAVEFGLSQPTAFGRSSSRKIPLLWQHCVMIAIISGTFRAPCHDRHGIGDARVDWPHSGGKHGWLQKLTSRQWEVAGIGRPDTYKPPSSS